MDINYHEIGRRIGEARREQKITQQKLAECVEVSSQYISHVETGKKKVSLKVAASIADTLDVTLDELILGIEGTWHHASEDWNEVMSDCSRYEHDVIMDAMMALKKALKENRNT